MNYYPHGRPVTEPAPIYTPSTSACKQQGCGCKDPRVLNYRKLRFFRALAEARGASHTRDIQPESLSAALLRPNEPEVVESGKTDRSLNDIRDAYERLPATLSIDGGPPIPVVSMTLMPVCACECACMNQRTVAYPTSCHECLRGTHVGR